MSKMTQKKVKSISIPALAIAFIIVSAIILGAAVEKQTNSLRKIPASDDRAISKTAQKGIRDAFENGLRSQEFYEGLSNLRSRGLSVLAASRSKKKNSLLSNHLFKTQALKDIPPRKLDLAPLPPNGPLPQANFSRSPDMEKLVKKIESETDTRIRERDLLLLAGKFVGQDDWEEAQRIYIELEANPNDPAVIKAAQRNLEVANLKLAILAETNPTQKELLELELANLHRDLGHKRAAKRMYHRFASSARDTSIRSQAKEMLSHEAKPNRLPVPPGFKQPE